MAHGDIQDDVIRAFNFGRAAYNAGDMRVAALNVNIIHLIGDNATGNPDNIAIMQSFYEGFDYAATEAANNAIGL